VPPQAQFENITAGYDFTCGVERNGSVACWGNVSFVQGNLPLAYGNLDLTQNSLQWTGNTKFTQVSAGNEYMCGLQGNTVICLGSSWDSPQGVFDQVCAGYQFGCGILKNQTIICWGANSTQQNTQQSTQQAPTGLRFSQVSCGTFHACAIVLNGSIVCWGNNDEGQGSAPKGMFFQVSAGKYHTCALGSSSNFTSITCWGQLTYSSAPLVVSEFAEQNSYRVGAFPAQPCPPGTFSSSPGAITRLCSGLCPVLNASLSLSYVSTCPNSSCTGPCVSSTPVCCPLSNVLRQYTALIQTQINIP